MPTAICLCGAMPIKASMEKIKTQLNELWQYASAIAASEQGDTDPSGFDKIDAGQVNKTIDAINEAIKDKPADKGIKQKLN